MWARRAATGTMTNQKPCIIAVGGVVYRHSTRGEIEVLLIRKKGGFWTLPKGQVKPGEAPHDAVAREIHEETGLTGPIEAAIQEVSYTIIKDGVRLCKTVTYYLVQEQGGQLRPSKKERIYKIGWFSIRAALKRIRRKRVRTVVQLATAILPKEGTRKEGMQIDA